MNDVKVSPGASFLLKLVSPFRRPILHLQWKVFQSRKEHSSPVFESCVNTIKGRIQCCLSWKWRLPGAVPHQKIHVYCIC